MYCNNRDMCFKNYCSTYLIFLHVLQRLQDDPEFTTHCIRLFQASLTLMWKWVYFLSTNQLYFYQLSGICHHLISLNPLINGLSSMITSLVPLLRCTSCSKLLWVAISARSITQSPFQNSISSSFLIRMAYSMASVVSKSMLLLHYLVLCHEQVAAK